MKVGEQIPVTIAGQTVVMAEVRELGDGTATLIVPATRVVMATRTELTVETPNVDTSGSQTLITGVEQAGAPVQTVEPAANTPEPAPVVSTPVAENNSAPAPAEQIPAPQTVEPVTQLAPEANTDGPTE